MKVYGVSAYDVDRVVHQVSREQYDGNLTLKSIQDCSNRRGGRATFTLQVRDSRAGQRGAIGSPGHSGHGPHGMRRRSNAACWHAHWDVIEVLLFRFPDARIVSGFRLRDVAVTYMKNTFRATALATAHLNIGRWDEPITMPQCCECDHTRYTNVEPTVDASLSAPAYRPGRTPTIPSWMPGSFARATYQAPPDDECQTSYAETNGGRNEPEPNLSGYYVNHREYGNPVKGGTYPWDAIPPAAPWKPGSDSVAGTLDKIGELVDE